MSKPEAILLAAGKGTRMGGDLPKVVYPVAGEPMIRWVVRACAHADCRRVIVVVGHRADLVREALGASAGADSTTFEGTPVAFVTQDQQLGTGHAAAMAGPLLEGIDTDVLVLCGDGPLIRGDTLTQVLHTHRRLGADATLATAILDDPTGYGRIVRDPHDGEFMAIVEEKDATEDVRAIKEINPSYYCFRSGPLLDELGRLSNTNASGEYYLTDVPGQLKSRGRPVAVVTAVPAQDVLGINTPDHLAEVDRVLRERLGLTVR